MKRRVKEKAVVILSGGMDSTVLLYDVMQNWDITALTFDYKQRHVREVDYATETCKALGIPHRIMDLSVLNEVAPSALTRKEIDVPDGRYDEPSMKATVVPNRNMIMLSLAVSFAISIKAKTVFFGAHSGDHTIYPDCRESFVSALSTACLLCDWHPVTICAPYMNLTKGEIAVIGKTLGVDFSKTYSCYKGGEKPCGTCGTCVERREAIEYANRMIP